MVCCQGPGGCWDCTALPCPPGESELGKTQAWRLGGRAAVVKESGRVTGQCLVWAGA